MNPPSSALAKLFDVTYLMLGTSFCVLVSTLPFLVASFSFEINKGVAIKVLFSLLLYPAIVGTFNVFTKYSDDADCAVLTNFWVGWKTDLRNVTSSMLITMGFTMVYVDVIYISTSNAAVVLLPFFLVMTAFMLRAAMLILLTRATKQRVHVRALLPHLRRRLFLIPISLIALVLYLMAADANPLVGLTVLTGPLLYLFWFEAKLLLT